ncbi:MAG: cation:proton antiporter [Pilosibacter sp.]
MLTSLALIFLVGLSAAAICGRLRLPRIIGMLFTGIILGPHVLGLLDDKILSISSELRQMALIIILLKYRKTGGNYGFRKIMCRKIFS